MTKIFVVEVTYQLKDGSVQCTTTTQKATVGTIAAQKAANRVKKEQNAAKAWFTGYRLMRS